MNEEKDSWEGLTLFGCTGCIVLPLVTIGLLIALLVKAIVK